MWCHFYGLFTKKERRQSCRFTGCWWWTAYTWKNVIYRLLIDGISIWVQAICFWSSTAPDTTKCLWFYFTRGNISDDVLSAYLFENKPYRIGKHSDYVRHDSYSSHKVKQWTSLNTKAMRLELYEDIKIKRDIQNLYICFCFFNQNNVEYLMKSEITYILHNEWEIFTSSIRNLFLSSLLCSAIEECNAET